MNPAAAFRRALEKGDASAVRRLWRHAAPHLPQPADDAQAEIVMHRARTEAASLPLKARAWSHRWLVERGLPSGLPDDLKPKAERMYPVVVEAVGVSVKARSPEGRERASAVQRAMSDAVMEAYADGVTDPGMIKARMTEARARVKG